MRIFTAVLSASALALGCGGKSTPAATPAATTAAMPGCHGHAGERCAHEGEGHEHASTPEVEKFHSVLKLHWHAAEGAQRTQDTCNAMPEFVSSAGEIKGATAPAGVDAAAWTKATAELESQVTALGKVCEKPTAGEFNTTFSSLHDSFHHLVELIPQG